MPRPRERTPELRRRILDVAIDVLANDGIDAVTTRRVADLAGTSPPAIYELFDHKAGLVREMFFEGFARLRAAFDELPTTDEPTRDLAAIADAFRTFARDNPNLFAVMYDRSFSGMTPTAHERSIGDATREFVVGRVGRCVDAGALRGDPTDLAHAFLALAIGLATQECAGWLGTTVASRDRRWRVAVDAYVRGSTTA